MTPRSRTAALGALVGAVLISVAALAPTSLADTPQHARQHTADRATPGARGDHPPAGPPYDFTTELMGASGYVIPLKNKAMLTRTPLGYLYRAGQQDSHLTITLDDAGLHFADTGTQELVKLAGACTQKSAPKGIAALCPMPPTATEVLPLLVEVWPRLGDDYTDGSSLPATIALTMLGDEGDDVALLGDGPDFFNGHKGRDRVVGGAGNDWIRSGLGPDSVYGGAGDDQIIGMENADVLRGGAGDDRLGGMEDDDTLVGGAGADVLLCGDGADSAVADALDKVWDCETLGLG